MTVRSDDSEPDPDGGGTRDEEFSRFYRSSFAALLSRCLWIGVPAADAPGVVQELMIEIYRRWLDIKSPEAYAKRTVQLRAVGFLKISADTPAKDEADLARLGRPLTSNTPDGVLSIDERQVVLQALSQLSPVQRAVFALYYDGFTGADIGAILNMEESTVRSNVRHARETLRAWWNQVASSDEGRNDP